MHEDPDDVPPELESSFGSPIEIVKKVKVEPRFFGSDKFECILTNKRPTKLISNCKLELSVYTTVEKKDVPRKLIAVARDDTLNWRKTNGSI